MTFLSTLFRWRSLSLAGLAFTMLKAFSQAPPTNDNFADTTRLEGTNVTVTGSLVGATLEPGETPPASGEGGLIVSQVTIWYSWAAPATGRAYFTTLPSSISQRVWTYTGSDLGTVKRVVYKQIASNNSFLASEGTVYHFQIGGFTNNGDETVTFTLELRPETPCDNDNFADATLLKGQSFNMWYTGGPMPPLHWVLGATTELGEPTHLGETPFKSLWWKWHAPYYGRLYLETGASTATNIVTAIYQGAAVEALTVLGKFTNVSWPNNVPITAGETYYIAAAVSTNAIGDVLFQGSALADNAYHPVPGNVLLNPSFEQGVLFDYWSISGGYGGYVGENGGADGRSWPVLGPGTKIWQEFSTAPGHQYRIRFIWRFDGDLSHGAGVRSFRVLWDTNEVGVAQIPADEGGFWHCPTLIAIASNTTSRFTIENLGYNTEVDGCSVVDITAAPEIVTQPRSSSTFVGGSAAFIVGVKGSEPIAYQWFFNGTPLAGATNRILALDAVSTADAGQYHATISNALGGVISALANLTVEAADYPVILWQPHSETVAVGAYVNLTVVAAGTPPLRYQWHFDNKPLADATNRFLTYAQIQLTNDGAYKVMVQNEAGAAWSLPATISVTGTNQGGATIDFRNRFPGPGPGGFSNDAPVFDIDGTTRLSGSNYVAQLYAGPSLVGLRPAGQPTPFYSGFSAGYFVSQTVILPNIAPGSNVVTQVRAWERSKGVSYEEARALGGKYGKSEILNLTTGPPLAPPVSLVGLQSFSLQAGLPYFSTGVIRFVEREPRGVVIWSLQGEPNSRYVVEKAVKDFFWEPYVVLTNVTGIVTFTDEASSGSHVAFYRARILD